MSGSIQNELDKAIEDGDWEAVGNHVTNMVDFSSSSFLSNDAGAKRQDTSSVSSGSLVSEASSDVQAPDKSAISVTTVDNEEKIRVLESLIESDDWKGLVDTMHGRGQSNDDTINPEDTDHASHQSLSFADHSSTAHAVSPGVLTNTDEISSDAQPAGNAAEWAISRSLNVLMANQSENNRTANRTDSSRPNEGQHIVHEEI